MVRHSPEVIAPLVIEFIDGLAAETTPSGAARVPGVS
jgi:hypothetical protein